MTCTAISLSGQRCDRRVGRSHRARRYQLCARHSRSAFLHFVQDMRLYDHLMQPDGEPDHARADAMMAALRESCALFGPAAVTDVLALAATVPNVGTQEGYVAAVLAVVVPRLQGQVEAYAADVRRQVAETDAAIAANEQRIADGFRWRDMLAQFNPTTTH